MDEKTDVISPVKRPMKALTHIDQLLDSVYQVPRKVSFSSNMDEAEIQKAVLYHRIRESPELLTGEKTPATDARCQYLADAVVDGRDPLVGFIRSRSVPEQKELLQELMTADTNMAWFEYMLQTSQGKMAAAQSIREPETKDPRLVSQARVTKQHEMAQGRLLQSIVENQHLHPLDFFRNKQNVDAVRRLLATELHRRQVQNELEDLKKVYSYDDKANLEEIFSEREPSFFENAATNNLEAHLKKLENSPEVLSVLQRIARSSTMEELSRSIINPPPVPAMIWHSNLSKMEDKLIPDAIMAFLYSREAPEPGSKADKALRKLADRKDKPFPLAPKPKECKERYKEYTNILEMLDKEGLLSGENGKKLKKELDEERTRLLLTENANDREKIKFNFRADTLIDYFDTRDPDHKPLDAIAARERLLEGYELEQKTFTGDDYVGTSQKITYDKDTGKVNKGPEKLITRVMNLSEKAGRKPQLQLEELRKIMEVLKRTDPFYVKNSDSYNNVLDSLNKVIKTQASMDKDANIRQVAELRALYAELDSNAGKYVKEKSERMKEGDNRAQNRVDIMKTLQSITGEKHVGKVTLQLYDEQRKMDTEQQMVGPCNAIMNKWKKAGTPTTPEAMGEFKRDFDALYERFKLVLNQPGAGELSYFKMGISEGLEDFTEKAKEVRSRQTDPEKKPDNAKLTEMNILLADTREHLKDLYAMNPSGPEAQKNVQKPVQKEAPAKKPSLPVSH